MAEFYVTYPCESQHLLAVIVGEERQAKLQFATREELLAAMDALGHEWQLRAEIQLPDDYVAEITAGWLEKAAEIKLLQNEPARPDSIFSMGSVSSYYKTGI